MRFHGRNFKPHVDLLAKKLKTSQQTIREYAKSADTSEHIENDIVPLIVEEHIRLQHLKDTHPEVYNILCRLKPFDNSYDRWLCALDCELRELKERGE